FLPLHITCAANVFLAFLLCHGVLRLLHSFPTRRSSDLSPLFWQAGGRRERSAFPPGSETAGTRDPRPGALSPASGPALTYAGFRSEEHTSELQSRENLVCRLLLEKKKKTDG